jgi:endonuclease/exonuclease/phosphatase family metal-dependent hydrolase
VASVGIVRAVRVATFNILHGRSPADGDVDVARFRAAVAGLDADVLALQEVDRSQPRSHLVDLTAVAAEAMGAVDHRFVATMTGSAGPAWVAAAGAERPDAPAYGIALLSRHPVRSWRVLRLPVLGVPVPMWFRGSRRPELVRDEPRAAVAASVQAPDGPLTAVCTHLSLVPGWNDRQLRSLVRWLGPAERPLVLMGDLNLGVRRAAAATRMTAAAAYRTFPADAPREQLDHVLLAGPVTAGATSAPRLPLSDHRPLVVELDR